MQEKTFLHTIVTINQQTKKEKKTMTIQSLRNKLEQQKGRSAWTRGVINYAWELIDNIEMLSDVWEQELPNSTILKGYMLNGASDWKQYSWGGSSLIYDTDIAKTLCAPWELKKTDNGRKKPNSREQWLDVQARALFQASELILSIVRGC